MPSLPTSNFWHPSFCNAVQIVLLIVVASASSPIFGQSSAVPSDDTIDAPISADEVKHFETAIRPALIEHCIKCHGDAKQEGGLRLDSRDAALKGGDSGSAVVPGDIEQSLILSALNHQDFEMPPGKKLDERTIREFTTWVAHGAHWPETNEMLRREAKRVTDEDRNWWAYKSIQAIGVPVIEGDDWSKNEIDRFVLKNLKSSGIEPAPSADEHVLLRRLYLQLIGMPPLWRSFVNSQMIHRKKRMNERLIDCCKIHASENIWLAFGWISCDIRNRMVGIKMRIGRTSFDIAIS